jgi:hypothetical protein
MSFSCSWAPFAPWVGVGKEREHSLLWLCAVCNVGGTCGRNVNVRFRDGADVTTLGGQVVCTRLVRVLNIELALST